MKVGRNDPCPCGSGKKYKKCCLLKARTAPGSRRSRGPVPGVTAEGLPLLVDAGSGDPVRLITDHWEVHDWKALATALEGEPDVDGDRDRGWNRFEEVDGVRRRPLLTLNPGQGNRLETFARTRRGADEGREWLARVAGEAIEHTRRESADPWSGAGVGALLSGAESSGGRGTPLPMDRETMQEIYRKIYSGWAEEPIPALGGETPRKAVESAEGREKVIELLEMYEDDERKKAQKEDREPVSFRFLWDAVGLDRDEALGE